MSAKRLPVKNRTPAPFLFIETGSSRFLAVSEVRKCIGRNPFRASRTKTAAVLKALQDDEFTQRFDQWKTQTSVVLNVDGNIHTE